MEEQKEATSIEDQTAQEVIDDKQPVAIEDQNAQEIIDNVD